MGKGGLGFNSKFCLLLRQLGLHLLRGMLAGRPRAFREPRGWRFCGRQPAARDARRNSEV